jgi:hypothetical protein
LNYPKLFIGRLKSTPLFLDKSKSTDSIIKLLVGALINRNQQSNSKIYYDLFNPSIGDFIIDSYLDDAHYVAQLIACLNTPSSIINLNDIVNAKKIPYETFERVVKKILAIACNEMEMDFQKEYIQELVCTMLNFSIIPTKYIQVLKDACNTLITIPNITYNNNQLQIIEYALSKNWISGKNENLIESLYNSIDVENYDEIEYALLSKISDKTDLNIELSNLLNERVKDFLKDTLIDTFIQEDYFGDAFHEDDFHKDEFISFVEKKLEYINVYFTHQDFNELYDSCDFEKILTYNYKVSDREDYDHDYNFDDKNNEMDEHLSILDLFDRK